MTTSTDWAGVKNKLAAILYSKLPLGERWKLLRDEVEALGWRGGCALRALGPELGSMARSASDDR